MHKIFIYTIILLFSLKAQAQHTLTGTVKDAQSKEALTGVNVFIPSIDKGTVTDIDGHFTLKNISSKSIKVEFSFVGYKPIEKMVEFDQSEKEIEVFMKETAFEMDEVIVSTGFNKLQKDNVMKVTHKNLASMERKGIQNLMDGVAQIPGVSAMSTGTAINKPVIRGLWGNRVLVYNQGVRLENYQFGVAHGTGVDQAGISGVEVIKGPASLLYGSDALGGVVYLIPEKYAKAHQTHADFKTQYYSNTSGFHSTLGVQTSADKWQFLARGAYRLNADYEIPSGERAVNSKNNAQDLKLGIGYQGKKITSDFRYNYNLGQNAMSHQVGHEPVDYKINGKYQYLPSHTLSLKNTFKLKNSQVKTNLGYSAFNRSLINQGVTFIGMQLNTLNFDAKWYLPASTNWETILGTQVMAQTNHNFGKHFLLPNAKVQNLGLFTTTNYTKDNIVVQAGLRFDYRHILTETISPARPGFNKHLQSLTGSLGFKTGLTKDMNLRLNLASGFRAPNLAELTSNGEHENKIEIGNPNLKNEQNIQADINWDYQSTHVEFFANGFYNHINNYIFLQSENRMEGGLPVYSYQQDNAKLFGGEFGFHFHPHPWDWLHIQSSFETVIGKKQGGDYLPLIPADQWKNEIRLTKNSKHKSLKRYYFRLGFNRVFTNRFNPGEDKFPAYSLVETGLGANFVFHKTRLNLNLSIHNLLNETYISSLSVLREDGIPNQGRNLILGVKLML